MDGSSQDCLFSPLSPDSHRVLGRFGFFFSCLGSEITSHTLFLVRLAVEERRGRLGIPRDHPEGGEQMPTHKEEGSNGAGAPAHPIGMVGQERHFSNPWEVINTC